MFGQTHGPEPGTEWTLTSILVGQLFTLNILSTCSGALGKRQVETFSLGLHGSQSPSDRRPEPGVGRGGFSDSGSGLPESIRGVRQTVASSTQAKRCGGRQRGQLVLTLNPNAPAHICS